MKTKEKMKQRTSRLLKEHKPVLDMIDKIKPILNYKLIEILAGPEETNLFFVKGKKEFVLQVPTKQNISVTELQR